MWGLKPDPQVRSSHILNTSIKRVKLKETRKELYFRQPCGEEGNGTRDDISAVLVKAWLQSVCQVVWQGVRTVWNLLSGNKCPLFSFSQHQLSGKFSFWGAHYFTGLLVRLRHRVSLNAVCQAGYAACKTQVCEQVPGHFPNLPQMQIRPKNLVLFTTTHKHANRS